MAAREWMLAAVAALAAVETTALILLAVIASSPTAPVLYVVLAVKYLFCWGVLRRRPGAWLALLLWEVSGAVAALARPGLPMVERLAELTLAGACIVLLGGAAALFPSPKLPSR